VAAEELVEVRECGICKEALHIFHVTDKYSDPDDKRVVAREVASGERHACFTLPRDANLLVLED